FRARFAARNDGAAPVTLQFVARIRLPNGTVYLDRVLATRTLEPGEGAAVTGGRTVPVNAPPGLYTVEFDVVEGGSVVASDSETFSVTAAVAAAAAAYPEGVAAHPNPLASRARLSFTLAEAAAIRLSVYDVRGR